MIRRPTAIALAATALTLLLAAGCGSSSTSSSSPTTPVTAAGTAAPKQLFASDFEGSCQGATISSATAYDPAAATHKVLYFSSYEDDLIEDFTTLPSDWQVTFEAEGNAYAAVDVVACAVRTEAAFVEECTGYENDGVPTQNVARLHTATYELTVREATTGSELGSTVLTGALDSCPMFVTFDSDDDIVDYYPQPEPDEVTAFLKPFVQP